MGGETFLPVRASRMGMKVLLGPRPERSTTAIKASWIGCASQATSFNAIAGCVYQIAQQSSGITRNAWLQEGLAETTGATTVDGAVAETGATEQKQMGQVMSAVMPKVAGRADGKRVSAAVRKRLGA